MDSHYSVKLGQLIKDFELEVLRGAPGFEDILIQKEDVNRPALQLAGFFDYFDNKRIQMIGRVEATYLAQLSAEERRISFDQLLARDIPCLIITRGMDPFPECMELAERYNRTILRTQETTSAFMGALIAALRNYLSPRITRHGVLVEVYGEGVLLMGDSGIGKSATALELIKRGHRLIADDAVDIKRISKDELVGSAPELIRYYMELRGIGVINVRHIYGVGAVKPETSIDLVVKMERWEEGKAYDRLGLSSETYDILGVTLPQVTIPVRPGRNLAVIMELAAMNNRQKKMGFNAAEALAGAHDYAIDAGLL